MNAFVNSDILPNYPFAKVELLCKITLYHFKCNLQLKGVLL